MPETRLTRANIDGTIDAYLGSLVKIGSTIAGSRGIPLLHELKRGISGSGPYADVSLFEAANRIMTDLVILNGVKWLLRNPAFPYPFYDVEYGHDNKQRFDIEAETHGQRLVGEAFNVASSFFQTKKAKMLRKLNKEVSAAHRLVMVNHDAVGHAYRGIVNPQIRFLFVDTRDGTCRLYPEALEPDA
jgi:hypothetical protein